MSLLKSLKSWEEKSFFHSFFYTVLNIAPFTFSLIQITCTCEHDQILKMSSNLNLKSNHFSQPSWWQGISQREWFNNDYEQKKLRRKLPILNWISFDLLNLKQRIVEKEIEFTKSQISLVKHVLSMLLNDLVSFGTNLMLLGNKLPTYTYTMNNKQYKIYSRQRS